MSHFESNIVGLEVRDHLQCKTLQCKTLIILSVFTNETFSTVKILVDKVVPCTSKRTISGGREIIRLPSVTPMVVLRFSSPLTTVILPSYPQKMVVKGYLPN